MLINVIMEVISFNSVVLKWVFLDIVGEIIEYVIYYMEDGNLFVMIDVVFFFGQYYIVEDLLEGICYVMEVVVRFNNGEGLKSVLQEVCIIDFSKLYVVELYVYVLF